MNDKKIFHCTDRSRWREWLSEHFETEDEIWFVAGLADENDLIH